MNHKIGDMVLVRLPGRISPTESDWQRWEDIGAPCELDGRPTPLDPTVAVVLDSQEMCDAFDAGNANEVLRLCGVDLTGRALCSSLNLETLVYGTATLRPEFACHVVDEPGFFERALAWFRRMLGRLYA
jgi:hypothetical protein